MPKTRTASQALPSQFKSQILLALVAGVCALFLGRLFLLQIRHTQAYKLQSEDNRIARLPLLAPRGEMLDARGKVLSSSSLAVDAAVSDRHLSDASLGKLCASLEPVLRVPAARLAQTYRRQKARTYAHQFVQIAFNLNPDQIARLAENQWMFPKVHLLQRLTSWYPNQTLAAHAIGYVSEVNSEDLQAHPELRPGDIIGRRGLEEIYNEYVSGRGGYRWAEVDAHGHLTRTLPDLPQSPPMAGYRLETTIDLEMARAFESAFPDSPGFGILMDANSGAIRAIFSKPAYDPNLLLRGDPEYVQSLLTHPDNPFFNRAVQSSFPPGSTFKVVNVLVNLEEGVVDPKKHFRCNGKFRLGNRVAHCWKREGHGSMDLMNALTHSCNVYFYNLGLELGVDRMSRYSKMFGFGLTSGIELPGEVAGFVPTADWKKQVKREAWTKGDDVNMAIGQGYLVVTPLQQVCFMSALFNGGKVLRPYLVERVVTPSGDRVLEYQPEARMTAELSDTTLTLTRQALRQVVLRGTGYWAGHTRRYRLFEGVQVYGKTGTVQRRELLVDARGAKAVSSDTTPLPDHGWFLSYIDFGDEALSGVVFVEGGGSGGGAAAPVIGRFVESMLTLRAQRKTQAFYN